MHFKFHSLKLSHIEHVPIHFTIYNSMYCIWFIWSYVKYKDKENICINKTDIHALTQFRQYCNSSTCFSTDYRWVINRTFPMSLILTFFFGKYRLNSKIPRAICNKDCLAFEHLEKMRVYPFQRVVIISRPNDAKRKELCSSENELHAKT